STPVPSGYSSSAERISDLRTLSLRSSDDHFVERRNEEDSSIGTHRHRVRHFRLLREFPKRRLEERTGSGAGIGCANQDVSRGGTGGGASRTVGRTGESTNLALRKCQRPPRQRCCAKGDFVRRQI